MYAEIVVNMPIEGTYHYQIPPELEGRLDVGHLVEVGFGKQKAQGVVIRLDEQSPVKSTRPVLALVDRAPVVNPAQLATASWLSEAYLAPLSQCVQVFLPPGLSRRGDVLITPLIDPGQIDAENDPQRRLLTLLARRGPLRGRQIARSLSRRDWQNPVTQLLNRGLIAREPILDAPAVNVKMVRMAELAILPERIDDAIQRYLDPSQLPANRRSAAERRANVLRVLSRERKALEVGRLYASVPGAGIADLRALAEDDLIVLRKEETWRDPLESTVFIPDSPPNLTLDQARAWDVVRASLDAGGTQQPILIHGVTGSGKTEVYLRAVDHVLSQGKSAIVLVPEIALTPQTIRRFGARFPGRMGLIHSQLSPGERYDTWRRARNGQFDVIVGPRSALFSPLANLGLIVVDECHDDSYKQSPPVPPPYYHTLPTAMEYARQHDALVIMGSATPNLTTYADARPYDSEEPGAYTLIDLPARIMGHRRAIEMQAIHYAIPQTRYSHQPDDPEQAVMIDLPPVQVVDMRQELRTGNRTIFSRVLAAALEQTLQRGEQVILFLNRRGTATYVFCRSCGHVLECPNCGTPLTWHMRNGRTGLLVCHHCNHRGQQPEHCPECGSDQIRYFGGGTERIEEEIVKRFPDAGVVRWDRDTTGGKGSHEALLQRFINRQANILIGTQMVAKGLDLPLVTLVGVISADTALYLPDFRSGERTFQLLTQVAGRAGRGLLGGEVVLQTYDPDHYAIRAAANHDFHSFYEEELRHRKTIGYPPFSRLVRLLIREPDAEHAQERAHEVARQLTGRIRDRKIGHTELIGPAPAFYPRRHNLYRWHVIIRGPAPTAILDGFRTTPGIHIDVDPVSLL